MEVRLIRCRSELHVVGRALLRALASRQGIALGGRFAGVQDSSWYSTTDRYVRPPRSLLVHYHDAALTPVRPHEPGKQRIPKP